MLRRHSSQRRDLQERQVMQLDETMSMQTKQEGIESVIVDSMEEIDLFLISEFDWIRLYLGPRLDLMESESS